MKKESSHISDIDYNPETKVMKVTFHNGKTYHYHDVPEFAHFAFKSADSHGKHFHKFIKNSYRHTKGD